MKNPQSTETPPPKPGEQHEKLYPPVRTIAIWGPLLGVTVIAILVILGVWHRVRVQKEREEAGKKARQLEVNVVPVKRDDKSHELILPGDIQAYQVATLFARTNGYLKAWYTDIGATVKEGQLMAEIEAPDVDAQLRQTIANLSQAKANLEIARLNFEREKDLLQKKVISQQEYDQARTTYEAQEAAVKAGQATVENLQVQQNFEKITAPFTGVVTKRLLDIGALVTGNSSSGTALFSVAQSDPLRIYVYVPQTNAPDIHDGMKARVLVEEYPGRDFEGTVARSAGAIDPTSRTLLTEVDLPNHDGVLYAGMYGQVRFVLESKTPPILIPANAFMFRTGGPEVATVTKDNRIHWQNVRVGRDFGTYLELSSGLDEGVPVVINPTDDLQEGVEVQVKQSGQENSGKKVASDK